MNSYNLMGIKSNGLLFWMPGFPNKDAKAHYRLLKRTRKMTIDWQYFISFTISNNYDTFVPLRDYQRYTGLFYSHEVSHESGWDYAHFKKVYADIRDSIPLYVSRFFNKFQQWCKRKYGKRNTYVWKLERGEEGRLHVHCLIKIGADIGRRRWPKELLAKIQDYWDCGFFDFQPLSGAKKYLRVMGYISKYFEKNSKLNLPDGTRRYGTSRDLPGYVPNDNVYYIHEQLIVEHCARNGIKNVILNLEFFKRFIKLWKGKFMGYDKLKLDDGRTLWVADVVFIPFKEQTTVDKFINSYTSLI